MRFLLPIRSVHSTARQCVGWSVGLCSAIATVVMVAIFALVNFGVVGPTLAQQSPAEVSPSEHSNLPDKPDQFAKPIRPFIENYCLDCHSGEDGEGGVDLDRFETQDDAVAELELWSKVRKVIEQNEMPPADADQPNAKSKTRIQNAILKMIDGSTDSLAPLGRLRRLNRVEYENTIRDLFRLSRDCFSNSSRIVQTTDYFQPATGRMPRSVLAVSCFFNSDRRHSDLPGVSSLPVDPPVEHGFANDQDALSLSPLLLENYFDIAKSVLDNREFRLLSGVWESMFAADDSSSNSELKNRAQRQLEAFLPRAFRREVTDAELKVYLDLFGKEFEASSSYTESMKTTAAAVLVSPNFLFRHEFLPIDPAGLSQSQLKRRRSYAMASRLSYFLWGSMPDDQLFQAAKEGRLSGAIDLEREVTRMMKHVRVKSLATNFGMEWLKLSKVASALPDKTLYPEYYIDNDKIQPPGISMMIEQLLFFEAIMVENRSILEFIKSDFGYLNRQLMDWYQIDIKKSVGYTPPHESFEDFYRVQWHDDARGGVISSGATLVATSTTTRTSPVYRGAWILDVIFNSPPPPAPANVPPLDPEEGSDVHKNLNVRDKLEQHRLDPACATCHDRIDPLGFALESFDAVGKKRNEYATGDQIDSSGKIDGKPFDSAAKFKEVIATENSRFVKAFVEHTMKYALGRQLHYSDESEIRRVTAEVVKEEHRFKSVIKQVVLSQLFQRFDEQKTDTEADSEARPSTNSSANNDSSPSIKKAAGVEGETSSTVENQ